MADNQNNDARDVVQQNAQHQRPLPGIKPPGPLILGDNAVDNWKLYKIKWNNYVVLTDLNSYSREYQVASLQNSLGDEILKTYTGLTFDTPEDQRTVAQIIQKLEQYIIGEVNETYQRFMFNNIVQKENESFECFYANCCRQIKTCNFCENCKDSIIRDRIILGIHDKSTQQLLLRERTLTLGKCMDICKAAENATHQLKAYKPEEEVHLVKPVMKKTFKKSQVKEVTQNPKFKPNYSNLKWCKFCGRKHLMKKECCPAWGKVCPICKQKNHLAIKCPTRQSQVHAVVTDSEDDNPHWINTVNSDTERKQLKCRLIVDDVSVVFQVDSGASVNLLPESKIADCDKLSTTHKRLMMWNKTNLTPVGSYRAAVENPKTRKFYIVNFVVVKEELTPLIGLQTATEMKLIQVNDQNMELIAAVDDKYFSEKYSQLWDGCVGTFEGQVHLRTDPTVTPVVMPAKRIPVSLKDKLKDELARLEELGVLAQVDAPTPWVNQIAITQKKSGDIRICLDPQQLNRALLREHFQLPILDDTLHELSNSRIFSKVDVASAYWHVQLDEESSLLTTFQTCFGRYRWLRLPFGLSVSSEIFQKKLTENLQGLTGLVSVADDVMVHGEDDDSHTEALEKLLDRCLQKGIRLNKDKFEQNLSEVSFMGHTISRDGLRTDPDKVKAIDEFPEPQNVQDLRRFLGMCNYLSRFLPNMTSITAPLRNLTKKDVPWTWSSQQTQAFDKVKTMIKSATALAYYDQNKELTLENDACDYGLGSVILQDGKPVAYGSRSLSDPETRYAQIEKQMLAVIFGLEKFHTYTFGRHVTVVTDHKPLVAIVKKPLAKAPARLQALLLRAQKYDFQLVYKSGKDIPLADALSRAPLDEKPHLEQVSVNNIQFCPIKSHTLDKIRVATQADNDLVQLMNTIIRGWPEDKAALPPAVLPFFSYRDELTVQDSLVLRGDRVVIPQSLRSEIKQKVHAGHLGIHSCLRRARQIIFWPRMSAEIRQYVESCDVCARYASKQSPEPLKMTDVPSRPWEKVGTDLFTLKSRNYLITVDYYSGFFEVDYLETTTSETVISRMKLHFARHGLPEEVVSDGGPQYTSDSFKQFSRKYGFTHTFSSPGNSKANGAAEAAVKICKNMMKKCAESNEDPYICLLNLRNTPTESLNTSPAERLLGRQTRTLLPTPSSHLKSAMQKIHNDRDIMIDKKASAASRLAGRTELKPLTCGQTVRMQPLQPGDKRWKQAKVVSQLKGRTYKVVDDNGTIYRRNRLHIRPSVPSRQMDQPITTSGTPGRFTIPSTVDQTNNELSPRTHLQVPLRVNSPVKVNPTPVSTPRFIPLVKVNSSPVSTPMFIPFGTTTRSGRVVKPVTKLNL